MVDPDSLVVGEEKRPPGNDGTAERGAELVAAKGRARRAGAVVEEGVRVEPVVAQEFVGAAVELVRAGLALDDRNGARGRPVLGRVVAGQDADLLD